MPFNDNHQFAWFEFYETVSLESSVLRGSANNDLTGLETSKIRNPRFQHISMYYSYLVSWYMGYCWEVDPPYVWLLEIFYFGYFPIYIVYS